MGAIDRCVPPCLALRAGTAAQEASPSVASGASGRLCHHASQQKEQIDSLNRVSSKGLR